MSYSKKWFPKREPWMPPDYDDEVIYAVRAVSTGTANEGQQKLFFDYLMYVSKASDEFADLSFRPGVEGRRATDFAEGMRFVGQEIRKLFRPEFTPQPKEHEPHRHEPTLSRRQIAQRIRRAKEKVAKERRNARGEI